MRVSVDALLDYYRQVYEETFRDLPIANAALDVEAVGFRPLDEHRLGVLIAFPLELPGSKVEFRVSHEESLGTILSAALFSTVADFPDQALAREVAQETLRLLFDSDAVQEEPGRRLSRRALLRRLGGMEGDTP